MLILFFILVNYSSNGMAWTGYTHEWICNKANLSNLDCTNADNPTIQSEHPDINFRYHHCASDLFDCDARTHADKFLAINTQESRGFAAHLYADSMVPVHWYSFDYNTCHKIFEDKVEEKLRKAESIKYDLFGSSIDFSKWNISMQCSTKIGKNYTDVTLYVDNMYMDTVAKYVADQMHSNYVKEEVNVYDLTKVVYVLVAIIIMVFILFIYFGMKNRKNNSNKRKKVR